MIHANAIAIAKSSLHLVHTCCPDRMVPLMMRGGEIPRELAEEDAVVAAEELFVMDSIGCGVGGAGMPISVPIIGMYSNVCKKTTAYYILFLCMNISVENCNYVIV